MATAATTTDRRETGRVRRYNRPTRWFHAFVYVTTLALLGTGWWLLAGREGQASYLAKFLGRPDIVVHKDVGWLLAGGAILGCIVGYRAVITFVRDSLTYEKGDLRWLREWPRAVFTGRFARHDGHFDPGQRIANVVIVVTLVALLASGIGLVEVHGGSTFVIFLKIHKMATFVFAGVIAGHIVVALGVLPGYFGVWRSMHFGGRVSRGTARRLWPGWTESNEPASAESPQRTD